MEVGVQRLAQPDLGLQLLQSSGLVRQAAQKVGGVLAGVLKVARDGLDGFLHHLGVGPRLVQSGQHFPVGWMTGTRGSVIISLLSGGR